MKSLFKLLVLLSVLLVLAGNCIAQSTDTGDKGVPSPSLCLPTDVHVIDTPNDNGKSITVTWSATSCESKGTYYQILTSYQAEGPFIEVAQFDSLENKQFQSEKPAVFGFNEKVTQSKHFYDISLPDRAPVYVKLVVGTDSINRIETSQPIIGTAKGNLFKFDKINNFIIVILLFICIYYFIEKARRNPNLFIRRIPGLEAIEEAIGRATEMGKPIVYLTGANDIDSVSTIASVNILSHVSKKVADYDSRIIVPCRWSIAMSVCQEVVREAYLNVGRPDAFNPHDVFYVSEDQFGFTAAVDGIMVREKPAANFFLGTFAAEAIILSETGASTGAIQIAGTDSTFQLPFFIVSCDYTLIGEELYAASAYLSREPKLLGSLRGQDAGKITIVIFMILASIAVTLHMLLSQNGIDLDVLLWFKRIFTVF